MTTLHDTSHIPDGLEYWDALAERIAAHATAGRNEMDSGLRRNDGVSPANAGVQCLEWLGRRPTPWVVSAVVLAAAVALLMITGVRSARQRSRMSDAWMLALSPRDPVGQLVNDAVAPPELGALLIAAGRTVAGAPGEQP